MAAEEPGPTGGPGPRQTWAALPWLVRTAVLWSACLVVIVAGLPPRPVAVLLAPLAIALAATIFLTALLDPVLLLLRRLRCRRRWPRSDRTAAARHPGRRRRPGVEPDRQPVR